MTPLKCSAAYYTVSQHGTALLPHHDAAEVHRRHAVEQQEHGGVGEGAEAEQQARRRQQGRDVQVGEVGGPGGGLVLCRRKEDR